LKRPSLRIREEIERLQEQLKQAETKEAERIGRLALKVGLGDLVIPESDMLAAFGELVSRFHARAGKGPGKPASRPQAEHPDA